jgi:hypothetical protein
MTSHDPLRSKLIRLAAEVPEIRGKLLPMLTRTTDPAVDPKMVSDLNRDRFPNGRPDYKAVARIGLKGSMKNYIFYFLKNYPGIIEVSEFFGDDVRRSRYYTAADARKEYRRLQAEGYYEGW